MGDGGSPKGGSGKTGLGQTSRRREGGTWGDPLLRAPEPHAEGEPTFQTRKLRLGKVRQCAREDTWAERRILVSF